MKNTQPCLVLSFALCLLSCNLDKVDDTGPGNPTTYKKTLGCTACLDRAYGVAQTSDGNFVITGETAGYGGIKNDAFLWKVDEYGNPVWDQPKLFSSGVNDDAGYAVQEAGNQNLIMTGVCNKSNATSSTLLVETFPDGSNKNTLALDNSSNGSSVGFYLNESRDILESNDGGLVYAGSVDLCNPGCFHMWLGKTDRQGIAVNSDGWGNGINTYGSALTKNTSGYFCAGSQLINSPANYDIFVAVRKTDDFTLNNNFLTKTNPAPGNQYATDLITMVSGNLLVVGSDDSNASGASDVLFIEMSSSSLDILTNKKISEPDAEKANAVIRTADGNYVLTGEVTQAGNTDLLLMKITKDGEKVWKFNYGGAFRDVGYGLVELGDGSLMIVGYSQTSNAPESSDLYLIRTDKDGKVQ